MIQVSTTTQRQAEGLSRLQSIFCTVVMLGNSAVMFEKSLMTHLPVPLIMLHASVFQKETWLFLFQLTIFI